MDTLYHWCGQAVLLRDVGGGGLFYQAVDPDNKPGVVTRLVDCPKCGAMLRLVDLSNTPPTETDRERALIDAVFNGGPLPGTAAVPADKVIREWIGSTEDAIHALGRWLDWLREWRHNENRERNPGDLDAAFRALADQGLDRWADSNPAGGGIDRLAEVVTRE